MEENQNDVLKWKATPRELHRRCQSAEHSLHNLHVPLRAQPEGKPVMTHDQVQASGSKLGPTTATIIECVRPPAATPLATSTTKECNHNHCHEAHGKPSLGPALARPRTVDVPHTTTSDSTQKTSAKADPSLLPGADTHAPNKWVNSATTQLAKATGLRASVPP